MTRTHSFRILSLAMTMLLCASVSFAIQPPQGDPAASKAYGVADLYIPNAHQPLSRLPLDRALQLEPQLNALGVPTTAGFYDVRAGRWGTLLAAKPLVPGSGAGNALTWAALGRTAPAGAEAYNAAVWQSFTTWLTANRAVLGVNTAELSAPKIGSYESGHLVHVYADRVVNGVPVRATYVTATLNSGNLVIYGAQNWSAVETSTTPRFSSDQARAVVGTYLAGLAVREWGKPELVIVPLANGAASVANEGHGIRHRLAWSIPVQVRGSGGNWEALVDAHDKELIAFSDRNQYFDARKVVGGILPVSNDGVAPDGVEQPDYPMSRAYVFDANGNQLEANSEGLVQANGTIRTNLTGPFVKIIDNCGAVNESTTCTALNLGTNTGTDCVTPPGASAGNTRSSRTGFYELNRLIDQAKSWLGPASLSNLWVNRQMPANMNINNACNAFFTFADTSNGLTGSINFYRESPNNGTCRNTGEIAAVFDHEWGHGLDFFDDSPGISFPGEAYADMTAIMRLNSSCIGRGFYRTGRCGGNGDPCTECSGVREADWKKRLSQMPHNVQWITGQNPTIPGNCGAITPGLGIGPCGRGTHCEGSVVTEAMWDLLKRDLPCHTRRWESFPGGDVGGGRCKAVATRTVDDNSALVLGTRLFYLASGGIKMGYQCDPAVGGCVATSWYLQILAADDDDGTLLNGTPHMVAINDAFSRHELGCGLPLALNFGCVATPAPNAAPVVTASAGVQSATITWTAVPGAAKYWVLRTDGVHGCNFGKTRVGEVAAGGPLTFTQTGLLDEHTYYYSVVPVGGAAAVAVDSCAGPMSDCASVTPLSPNTATGASASIEQTGAGPVIQDGDGDPFVDNCETADLSFNISNSGGVPLTNVRVTAIAASSAQTQILTPLPIALSDLNGTCGLPGSTVPATFRFRAGGLASQSTLTFTVTVESNEAAAVTGTLTVTETETDLVSGNVAYDFENGTQGWTVTSGTFDRVTLSGTGGEGTSSFMKSSSATDNACDRIQSPKLRLTSASTLSLHNQFITESEVDAELPFYDRANVGVVDAAGQRTIVGPDGGRVYNALNTYTGCNNGPGWATSTNQPVNLFAVSNWSSAVLGGANYEGQEVQIEVANGTDTLSSAVGFQFDQVRISNVLLPVADQQPDVCPSTTACFEDNAPQLAYTDGWHAVNDADASGGTFRLHLGKSPEHNLKFSFDVASGSSTLEYKYATSKKGGTAEVYIDGVFRETVNYAGTATDTKNPDFNVAPRTYSGLSAGSHTFELKNMRDAVYVDKLCVANGGSSAAPAASPGTTSSSETTLAPGQGSQGNVLVPAGAMKLSVAAIADGNALIRLVVIDPLGGVAGISESSNGIAAVDTAVSGSGLYVVKVVNLSLGKTNVWTVSTPLIGR